MTDTYFEVEYSTFEGWRQYLSTVEKVRALEIANSLEAYFKNVRILAVAIYTPEEFEEVFTDEDDE